MTTFLVLCWKQIVIVALVGALLATVYGFGYHNASNHYQRVIAESELKAASAQAEAVAKAQEASDALGEQSLLQAKLAAEQDRKAEVVTNTVVKWKVKYAQSPDAGKCVFPADFVRVHTAAVTGRLPDDTAATGRADAGPARVTDVDLLDVDTSNYAMCRKWRGQLIEWRDRERALEALR